jgi:hypothetical protein
VITVSGETHLLSQAIPTKRFTVITLPWNNNNGIMGNKYFEQRINMKFLFTVGMTEQSPMGMKVWGFQNDPEKKQHCTQGKSPGSPCPWKARLSKSKAMKMFICFFACTGIVHTESVPPGQTGKQKSYFQVLECLREHIHHVRRELFPAP